MPRAGLTHDRVVNEAAVLADEIGLDRVTLAAVAQRFGVALPSLYKHIEGMDGLQRDLAVVAMRQLAATFAKAAAGRARTDALTSLAHAYRSFAHEHPGLYAATMRSARPDDAEHVAVSQEALDVLVALMAGYGIDGSDAVHAIRFSRSALHGFLSQESSGAFGMAERIDESFRLVVAAIDAALDRWDELG